MLIASGLLLLSLAAASLEKPNEPADAAVYLNAFEQENALDALPKHRPAECFAIVADPEDQSNHALELTIEEAAHYGGSFHVALTNAEGVEPTRAYLRYRLRLGESWAPKHGGKLPGFNGTYNTAGWGGRPSDGKNGWSARGLFGPLDDAGLTPIGSYIYHADTVEQDQTYGNSERWDVKLERGRWYTIEQEIQLETVSADGGQADGWLRAWVDGKLVFDRQNLHVRDTDALKIESVWMNLYYGGKVPAPSEMSLLIDDFEVRHERPEA